MRERPSREDRDSNLPREYRDRSPIQGHFSPHSEPHRAERSHHHRHRHRKESHFSDSHSPPYMYKSKTPPYSKSATPPPVDSTPPPFEDRHATYTPVEYEGGSPVRTPVEFLNDQEYSLPAENYEFEPPTEEDQYLELDEAKDDLRDDLRNDLRDELRDNEYSDPHLYRNREIMFSPHQREILNQGSEREVIAHSPDHERFVIVFS